MTHAIVTRNLAALTAKTLRSQDINNGYCYLWAYLMSKELRGARLCSGCVFNHKSYYEVGVHAFVRYKGKFFDCENLDGVDNPSEFRIFHFKGNATLGYIIQSRLNFAHAWSTFGRHTSLMRKLAPDWASGHMMGTAVLWGEQQINVQNVKKHQVG